MHNIHKRFGATTALAGAAFSIAPGEVHALIGENGAGKSTLMNILSGTVPADRGSMWLNGWPFDPRNPLDARRADVAIVYQTHALAEHLSVMENILLGMEPTRMGFIRRNEIRRRAQQALAEMDRSDIRLETPVRQLPLAARQMVAIARAAAVGCQVLVLDEPTSSLERPDVERLFRLVRKLKGQGCAIVYISHFLEEVLEIADRYTVLRDGRAVGSGPTADATTDQLAALIVGRQLHELYPRSPRKPGETVLELTDLAGDANLRSVTMELRRGQVLGIAGLVGSGRTELLRTIFGLEPVRSGKIRVGAYLGPASPSRRLAQGIGMLSENRKGEGLALGMDIAENVTLSQLRRLGPLGLVLPRRQDAAAMRLIEQLGIRARGPRQPVSDLSDGNQQKVALARLLYHDVDILLLDEPTRGIDIGAKATIYRLIDELAAGNAAEGLKPRAVLVVSSYLPELMGVCDAVAVMRRGRLGPFQPIEDIDEHKLMLEATRAEEAA